MKVQTMRRARQFHHYIAIFFAPMILLFAFSGALQIFRLQEARGFGGKPPQWIVWMAAVHKDQAEPRVKAEKAGPGKSESEKSGTPAGAKMEGPRHSPLPLKIFVALLSIGLMISTILGIVIALNSRATRRVSMVMLAAGTALPLALLYF